MERDQRVFVFGLDVDDHKAIQGSTRGLVEEFGPERVFGTPLSEDAMTGVAIGAAMAGMRPDPCAYPHGFSDARDEPADQYRRQDPSTCMTARSRCRWSCAA